VSIFSRPKERFSVYEVGGDDLQTSHFYIDEDRKISRAYNFPLLNFDLRKRFEVKKENRQKYSIVTLSPDFSAVRFFNFKYIRPNKDVPIDEVEIENFLAQLTQKMFLEFREEVGEEMGRDELDTILLGSRPVAFFVDSSLVHSPVGLRGREVKGVLELIFTDRASFDVVQPIIYSGDKVFLTTKDKSELMAVAHSAGKSALLDIRPDGRSIFLEYEPGGKDILRRQFLVWSLGDFLGKIAETWGLGPFATLDIYDRYLNGAVSSRVAEQILKLWRPALNSLLGELSRIKANGDVYFKAPIELPKDIPFRKGRVELKNYPHEAVLPKLGFELDKRFKPNSVQENFAQLAPLIECYYDKGDERINHPLRRRIHWLISH
jgi:hypothetical protein